MFPYLSSLVFVFLLGIMAAMGFLDKRKTRPTSPAPSLSFVVPCFNDADSIGQTLKSIYETCGQRTDVVVIDDCSTDGGRAELLHLKNRYGFKLILNHSNQGKARTLNKHFHHAKHAILVFVDADVIVNRKSLADAVARLQRPDVGAVSCPYKSANAGFMPLMQTIEYNMLAFIHGAYNLFSALSLWGGFIVVKRQAFLEVGRFTLNAISEDIDLAYKLNKNGWRVEQSFHPIHTQAPNTFLQWYQQKIRWSAGAFQCFVRYRRVWIKNPLHLLFLSLLSISLLLSILNLMGTTFVWDDTVRYFMALNRFESVWISLQLSVIKFSLPILQAAIRFVLFTLLALPFVWPLISTIRRLYVCFLIIPFSVLYIPIFSLISAWGVIFYFRKRRLLMHAARAW